MLTLPFLQRHLTKYTGFKIFETKTVSKLRMLITYFFLRNVRLTEQSWDMLSTCAIAQISCGWGMFGVSVSQINCGCGRCFTSVSLGFHVLQHPLQAPSQMHQQLSVPCTQMFNCGETFVTDRGGRNQGRLVHGTKGHLPKPPFLPTQTWTSKLRQSGSWLSLYSEQF